MKTIKVIDLLNKIANDTLLDNTKVVIEDEVYTYNKKSKRLEKGSQYRIFSGEHLHKEVNVITNDKAEIIEEDKEIEEVLDINLLGQCDNWLQKRDVNIKSDFELNPYILEAITDNFKSLYHKQCELVKAVNELKKGK